MHGVYDMTASILQEISNGIADGSVVPYIGPGALAGVTDNSGDLAMPADSDSLILAMNNGRPMSARLMYEFPRAAMDVELKRGRSALHRFLETTYGETRWTRAPLHDWLAAIKPSYVIDINRDTQLQDSYADTPHTLIRGIARIGGTNYRFRIHHFDGKQYSDKEIDQQDVDPTLPVLFKPMGSPVPDPTYIASDADYVDYITELMGGFAIPTFVKQYRRDKQYVFLGLRMTRDTERMVLSDFVYDAAKPTGWALIAEPTDKEVRFCRKMGIEIIEADIADLLAINSPAHTLAETLARGAQDVGC
jgi:hypothetical protein